jgi:hypothetical protein
MVSVTIDANDTKSWINNYFFIFRKWHKDHAPKPLPAGAGNYIKLYSEYIGIEYEITTNMNAKGDDIESFTFTWQSEQDKTMFLLRH